MVEKDRPWEEVRKELEKRYPVKKAVQDLFKEIDRQERPTPPPTATPPSEQSNQ